MSPLPIRMQDRWEKRTELNLGEGTIYWHILLHDHPQVRALASEAQRRLSSFTGLHFTPEKWLHVTTLVVGSTVQIPSEQTTAMLREATRTLSDVQPISVSLGRVLYHPEAIMLGVQPERALDPILQGVRAATRSALGKDGAISGSFSSWTPHVTVAYSTAEQPAEPIIATLGKKLPTRTVLVNAVTLVIQRGAERLWDWKPIGTIRLGTGPAGQND